MKLNGIPHGFYFSEFRKSVSKNIFYCVRFFLSYFWSEIRPATYFSSEGIEKNRKSKIYKIEGMGF